MERLARFALVFGLVVLGAELHGQQSAAKEDLPAPRSVLVRDVTIPDSDSTSGVLGGWLVFPGASGKHPLVVIGLTDTFYPDVGPGRMLPEAEWFVRRGWAVGIFLRRGYGTSGKFPHIGIIKCGTQDMEEYTDYQTKDLHVAFSYFSSQPEVDGTRVIVAENSGVWGDSLWFADGAPTSLKGILNFGRNGLFDFALYREKCLRGSILPALRRLGATSHVPMLWVYGKVKKSGEVSTQECLDAFVGAGGNATFEAVKDYDANNAGYLFNMNADQWGPLVEAFLAKQGLPSQPIYAVPQVPDLKLPKGASEEAQAAFAMYLLGGPSKAFALGSNGAWAYRFGRSSQKAAENDALDGCAGCVIVSSAGN